MKIINNTTFRARPFQQIVARLGDRLGRTTPRKLKIDICCHSYERCAHATYLSGSLSNSSGKQHDNRQDIDVAYLWFPKDHSQLNPRDVAYALDCLMRFRGIVPPIRIQDRVALIREYQWADKFPLAEVAVPRPRAAKEPPSKAEQLKRRRDKLSPLIAKWKRARNAADYNVRKYEREQRSLDLKIAKEAGRESHRQNQNHE